MWCYSGDIVVLFVLFLTLGSMCPLGSRHRIHRELMATSAAAAALLLSPRANSHGRAPAQLECTRIGDTYEFSLITRISEKLIFVGKISNILPKNTA